MPLNTREPLWQSYLFAGHSRVELSAWARRLRYFRFCRAYGAHSNDGDRLLVALRYTDADDLRHLLRQLGLPAAAEGIDAPKLTGYAWLAGQRVFLWEYRSPMPQLEISLTDPDNLYEVTPRAVAAAEIVETLLKAHEARLVEPPQPDRNCVCPAYYPELWMAE